MSIDFSGLVEDVPSGPAVPPTPWGEWYKTDQADWSRWGTDIGAWESALPRFGFKGKATEWGGTDEWGGGGYASFTPEAEEVVKKLQAAGYDFLREGGTHNQYTAIKTPEGNYRLNQKGPSFFDEIAPALGFIAMPFTGGLSAALGGGLAGTIAANALVSGGIGALSGGDFLDSALKGGLSAGIGTLVSPIANSIGADILSSTGSQALSDIASGAIKGGARGLPSALISGNGNNILAGALTGGIGGAINSFLPDIPNFLQRPISSAISSELFGSNPAQPFAQQNSNQLSDMGLAESQTTDIDPSLLFALGAMMTPQQQKKQEDQFITPSAISSPFGMDLLV